MLHLCVGLALVPIAGTQHHGLGAEPCRRRTAIRGAIAIVRPIKCCLHLCQGIKSPGFWLNSHKPRECQCIAA